MTVETQLDCTARKTQEVRNFYEMKYSEAWHGIQMGKSRFTKMWYRSFIQHCIPHLSLAGSRVVEVGCGAGLLGAFFSQQGARFFGVDLALSAVSQFPRNGSLQCFPTVADATLLPFPTGTFDLLLCMEVLEHALEPVVLLDECFRVVRSGGYLVFSTPNLLSLTLGPKVLGDLGIGFFRRYVGRQIIDKWMTSLQLRRLLGVRGRIDIQRAVRLHPPFFEQLDFRFPERNPLRRVNDLVFGIENRWGDRFPLNCMGQHTLCLVQAGAPELLGRSEKAASQRDHLRSFG